MSPPASRSTEEDDLALEALIPKGRRIEGRTLQALFALASLALFVGVWELVIVAFGVKQFTLPPPASVASELWQSRSSLWAGLQTTLAETFLGFLLAAAVGVLLACGIATSRVIEQLVYPILIVSNAVPKIALAPVFIVWLGFGSSPRVVLAALLALFPIVISTAVGLVGVDKGLLRLARSTRATRLRTFRIVRLPAALPSIMGGLKVGISLALTGAVVGELVGGNSGLGYIIVQAQGNLLLAQAFASIVVLAVAGVILFYALDLLEKLVSRHH